MNQDTVLKSLDSQEDGRRFWTLLGDHHLLDHPPHRRAGGDGFTAETAETAEEHAEETTASESGFRPPDPPDPPSWLCREGGDGFTAETAETAEEHAEKPESASGFRPPDPPDPPSWLWPHLRGLGDLCGEPRVAIATVAAARPVGPRWGSPRRVRFCHPL